MCLEGSTAEAGRTMTTRNRHDKRTERRVSTPGITRQLRSVRPVAGYAVRQESPYTPWSPECSRVVKRTPKVHHRLRAIPPDSEVEATTVASDSRPRFISG